MLDELYSRELKGEFITQKRAHPLGEGQSLDSSLFWAAVVGFNPSWILKHLQKLHVVNKSRLKSSIHLLSTACLCSLFIKNRQNSSQQNRLAGQSWPSILSSSQGCKTTTYSYY